MPLSSQRRIENECSWRAAEHLGIVESAFAQSAESRNRLLLADSRHASMTAHNRCRHSIADIISAQSGCDVAQNGLR